MSCRLQYEPAARHLFSKDTTPDHGGLVPARGTPFGVQPGRLWTECWRAARSTVRQFTGQSLWSVARQTSTEELQEKSPPLNSPSVLQYGAALPHCALDVHGSKQERSPT